MSNWRELLAGRELDRIVAERLGFRPINLNAAPDGVKVKTLTSWVMLHPGEPFDYHFARGIGHTKRVHCYSEAELMTTVLRYSTSADAALTLPIPNGDEFEIAILSDHTTAVRLNTPARVRGSQFVGALPDAMCRAWLSCREREAADGR